MLHRIEFLIYMAGTVPGDEPDEKIREYVEDGCYWLDDLENINPSTRGASSQRVKALRETMAKLTEALGEDEGDDEEDSQTSSNIPPAVFKKASELRPGDLGRPMTRSEKGALRRRIMAAR